jgi:hypothetical protein
MDELEQARKIAEQYRDDAVRLQFRRWLLERLPMRPLALPWEDEDPWAEAREIIEEL